MQTRSLVKQCVFISLISMLSVAQAADPSEPHEHQGIIPAYKGEPPRITLTPEEDKIVNSGDYVRKQVENDKQGSGAVVFRVDAPPSVVWSVIRDFPSYPKWIKTLSECEVYRKKDDRINVRFVLSTWGQRIEYFITHKYPTSENWGTWTLDYSKNSDLDDSVGYWRVTPWPNDPNKSRVEYSVGIAIKGWIPGFIKSYIVNKGLSEATEWVREQSVAKNKTLVNGTAVSKL